MKKLFLMSLVLLSSALMIAGSSTQKENSEIILSYLQLKKTAQWNGAVMPQIVSQSTTSPSFSFKASLFAMADLKAQCLQLQKQAALEKKYRHQACAICTTKLTQK